MNPAFPNEYVLHLSTGETIQVSELDLSILGASPAILAHFAPLQALCTQLTRSQLEEAKGGYDEALKSKLRSPPVGCLIKNPAPVCSLIASCSMANKKECTTKNVTKRGGKFPDCWTVETGKLQGFERAWAAELSDVVIHAWRAGRHVFVVIE